MVRRIWHALFIGHTWKQERVVYLPGTNTAFHRFASDEGGCQTVWGRTDITEVCHCGAWRTRKITGCTLKVAKGNDPEASELRRMAGLD